MKSAAVTGRTISHVTLSPSPVESTCAPTFLAATGESLAIDVAVFKEPWTAQRGFFALLIVAGACGLRIAAGR